jgi:hypothetical protein
MMVNLVPVLADAIHGLEWFIASAPSGKAFVTCDAPVIITRPPNHNLLMGVGLTTLGSEKIIPLSSRFALLIADQVARPMVAHVTIDRDHLRWINEALVRRCERFTMGRSRVLLESLLKATGIGGTPTTEALGAGRRPLFQGISGQRDFVYSERFFTACPMTSSFRNVASWRIRSSRNAPWLLP